MQWVQVRTNSGLAAGVLSPDGRVCLPAEARTTVELLGLGASAMAEIGQQALANPSRVVTDRSTWGPAVNAPSLRDFLCFLQHMRNCRGGGPLDPIWSEIPAFYFSNPAAVIGPFDPVGISPGSSRFDFELEVGAIIGRAGSDLHPDEADACIAGYTIFCDWSARDLQMREMPMMLGPAKGKDGATTLGPALVTVDELEPHRSGNSFDLGMRAFVNGEAVGGGNLNQMDWSFAEIVAYASRGTTLQVGDVVGSGTVPTGCLLEHFVTAPANFRGWLQPGDVVRLEVDGIGAIEQAVVAASQPQPVFQTGRTAAG